MHLRWKDDGKRVTVQSRLCADPDKRSIAQTMVVVATCPSASAPLPARSDGSANTRRFTVPLRRDGAGPR